MVTIQSKIVLLVACIGEVAWLLLAQTLGSTILLIPCLACFLVLVAWTAIQGMTLPVLMFFLPFSTLLKIRPGMISFYTVALLIAYLIYAVKGIKNISIKHLVPGLALLAMALVVKTLYGESIDNSFILFFFTLLLIPFFKRELGEKYDFYDLTMGFALGIVLAAITARFLIGFPAIRQYIRTHEYSGLVRYSGYYGDPNFYSAHITAALGGVLILMINTIKKFRIVLLMILAVLLVYCGALSVSKSFWLIAAAVVLFWLIAFMLQKGKITAKITILLTVCVGIVFLLSSTVFYDQFAMFMARLSQDQNLSDFTTHRTELWDQYITALINDPKLLFFGRGLSSVLVNDRGSHNTLIQGVYQFGLLGSGILTAWFVFYIRTLLKDTVVRQKDLTQIAVLLIGALGPWVGLDVLRFDEFFLIPMYVCVGVMFLSQQDEEQSEMIKVEEMNEI
ncbi:MAG: hypothetical protein IJW00_01405 [Clostridia bacterium]|nr:hypothetical protein [Clostridia bacterium]